MSQVSFRLSTGSFDVSIRTSISACRARNFSSRGTSQRKVNVAGAFTASVRGTASGRPKRAVACAS